MVKIITDERAKEILEESRSSSDNFRVRYYRLNEDDGQKVIEFITPIYEVETNDEDLLGRIWEYEWSKNEAKVLMDGKEIIWGFGGPKSPNLRIFLRALTTNNIKMTDLPGTIWSAQRTGKWDYEYKLIGRKDKTSKKILKLTDILIAGRYDENFKINNPLLSSLNQKILFLSNRYSIDDINSSDTEIIIDKQGNLILSGVGVKFEHVS